MEFYGYDGSRLAALLETPDKEPRAYALFAHCFSCGKDVAAASRISRALSQQGYAVLRFDFTGLGNSDGDFANANFSSNVEDLILAADFLKQNYSAPRLLIGHSLGGTAVLSAATKLESVEAVVTIGAPAEPMHVIKQFVENIETIETEGVANVELAGRTFTIKKQFLDDVRAVDALQKLGGMKKALLVLHSPVDTTVSIHDAEKIYASAKHPKSFVSLDTADHLLTKKADAEYVALTIAGWASRYLTLSETVRAPVPGGEVLIEEHNHKFGRRVTTDSHVWLADEPKSVGGGDQGPDPYEHLLAALGTCTSMTIRMYANRKKLPLEDVLVKLRHSRDHVSDCENCDESHRQIDTLHRDITLTGDLSDGQRNRLLEIADRCPVHRTLEGELRVTTTLVSHHSGVNR